MSRIFSNLKLRGFPQFRTYYMLFSASRQEGIFSPSPRPRFSDAFVHNRICRSASPRRWPPPSWDRVTDRRTQSAFQKKRTETRRPLLLSDRSDTPLYRRSSAPLHRWIASIRQAESQPAASVYITLLFWKIKPHPLFQSPHLDFKNNNKKQAGAEQRQNH